MRLEELLLAQARRTPRRPICTVAGTTFSYGEVDERSRRLAAALTARGLGPGDRVVAELPNGVHLIETLFATARAGLVLVPFSHRATASERDLVLAQSGARAIISAEQDAVPRITFPRGDVAPIGYDEAVATSSMAWSDAEGSDLAPCFLAYTSGSTGQPKGVVLSHRAKYLSAVVEAVDAGLSDIDVALVNTPMFHVHGLVQLLMMVAAGGRSVVTSGFRPDETASLILAEGVTQVSMVPTMYQALLQDDRVGSGLFERVRAVRCTGAPLGAPLKRAMLERWPGLRLEVLYGATEGGAITSLKTGDVLRRDGSVGQPVSGVTIEIRDAAGKTLPPGKIGEVFIRSDYIFTGYQKPDQPLPEHAYRRWISLGDLGEVDDEGFLFLRGRASEIIITGGENVAALEVERAIETHDAVQACAVIGLPDRYWGEVVTAFVELKPGAAASSEELLVAAGRILSRYKLPKRLDLVPALPRNSFGKVDKKALKSAAT